MPCYRDASAEVCKQLVGLHKLACGHMRSVVCGETFNAQKVQCEEAIEKRFPCGHTITTKCHKSAKNVTCNKKIKRNLNCGHTVLTQCTASLTDVKCGETLKRKLPCRHEIQVACGSFEAQKPVETIFCRYLF